MAASVTYKINGKYDGKAIAQAQKGLNDLTGTAKSLTKLFIGGLSVGKLVSALKDANATFRENNREQTRMFQALSRNAQTATTDIKALVKEFDSMSGIFGGSDFVKGGTVLAAMGLDADQMRKVAKTAQDMAASGIMPLETAFEALGKSYGGNVSQLKKLYPELGKLSDAELKAGKAVEYMGEKFSGMAEAFAGTTEGKISTMKDIVDGIKDSVGSIGGFLIDQNGADMINFLSDLKNVADSVMPNIAAWTSTIVHAFSEIDLSKIFSLMPIKNYFSFLADTFVQTLEWIKAKSKKAVTSAKLEAMEIEYTRAKESLASYDAMPDKKFDKLSDLEKKSVDNLRELVKDYEEMLKESKKTTKLLDMPFSELINGISDSYATLMKENLGALTGEDMVAYFNESLAKYSGFLSNPFSSAGGGKGSTGGTGPLLDSTGKGSKDIYTFDLEDIKKLLGDVRDSFGDIGTIIKASMDGSVMGLVMPLIQSAVSVIGEKTTVLTELMSAFTTIFREIFSPEFISLLNAFFGPIVEIIKSMGRALGTQLSMISQIITPILSVIAKAMENLFKVFETVSALIYNLYVAVYNAFNWRGKKEYKDIAGIWSDSSNLDYSAYSTATSGSSTTASYNAARDVYVTINYNHSFVNGDAREIALGIRDEILSAERLGL